MIVAEAERLYIPFFFNLYDRGSNSPFFKIRLSYKLKKDNGLIFFSIKPLIAPIHRYMALGVGAIAFFFPGYWLIAPGLFLIFAELFYQEFFYKFLIRFGLKREKYSLAGLHFLSHKEAVERLIDWDK